MNDAYIIDAARTPRGIGKAGKGADVKPKEVVGSGSLNRITVYSGTPGPACGHSVQASSYFDRLWQRGINRHVETHKRFFLVLRCV